MVVEKSEKKEERVDVRWEEGGQKSDAMMQRCSGAVMQSMKHAA
jgi:hypothetical protein